MLPEDWDKLTPTMQRQLRAQAKSRSRKGMSITALYKSMEDFRKSINDTGRVEILNVRASNTKVPYLIVEAQVRGSKLWQQVIHFTEAVMDTQPRKGWVPIAASNRQYWYMRPIQREESVKVRCSCPDFQHTFSWEDFDGGALQGRRIRYQKVAGSNRGPRNKDHVKGVCKHIRAVIHELQKRHGRQQILEPIPGSFTTATPGYQWRK
ncbi:SWIM-type zinc finger protein [Vibrio phage 150E35-1]|nr:SWIM-type zinc finger protein [Vibrio phage 150E35-1]